MPTVPKLLPVLLLVCYCRLAAQLDVVGVIIGSIVGHAACTGAAVLGGKHLAEHIDEKLVGVRDLATQLQPLLACANFAHQTCVHAVGSHPQKYLRLCHGF